MIIELNEANFKTEINEWVVLVDFWANDCNPCIEMLNILENFSKVADKNLKIWKLNWDSNLSIVQEYRIMSAPTIILFKDWKPVELLVWVQTAERLEEITKKYL